MQAVRDIAEHRVRGLQTVIGILYAALCARKSELQRQAKTHPRKPTLYLAARDQLARPLCVLIHTLARFGAESEALQVPHSC